MAAGAARGLIFAQSIYVYQFLVELWHLLHDALTQSHPPEVHDLVLAWTDKVMMSAVKAQPAAAH